MRQVTYSLHHSPITKPTVTIRRMIELEIPNPTEDEINRCPDRFRCFSCLEGRGKKEFAGEVRQQRICRNCRPFVDGRTVRGLITHDLRGGHPVRGFGKSKMSFKSVLPATPPKVLEKIAEIARRLEDLNTASMA